MTDVVSLMYLILSQTPYHQIFKVKKQSELWLENIHPSLTTSTVPLQRPKVPTLLAVMHTRSQSAYALRQT